MSTPIAHTLVNTGEYQAERHFYPRVPNASLHPLVGYFLTLSNERIAARYCHLNPHVNLEAVNKLLSKPTRYFRWAGADLFHVTDDDGRRRFVVIETNSSPSGQKSMPLLDPYQDQAGYRKLLERAFLPMLKRRALPKGALAVLWDKNWMEASGYAAVLADLTDEPVHLIHVPDEPDPAVRCQDGVLHARTPEGWIPIRAAFRYVTQKPWNRLPPVTKTAMLNPIVSCLAGGRNKSLAAIAYDLLNAELDDTGLTLRTPETIPNVGLGELPLHIDRMGGVAMVKVPYGNAGVGVDPITTPEDLSEFMARTHHYDRFLVQGLIGNTGWSSKTRWGRLYHVGTMPSKKGLMYVADLRFMVGVGPEGFFPVALYSRRAPAPLAASLHDSPHTPWEMLGTNLSKKQSDGSFTTEPDRLMLMDNRDFNHLGLGLDDLVEAYVQTALATKAIDGMSQRLVNTKGKFRNRLFSSLVNDPALHAEVAS